MIGSGLPVAALEYIDSETMRYASASFPGEVPDGGFAVLAEADGSTEDLFQKLDDTRFNLIVIGQASPPSAAALSSRRARCASAR